MYLKVLSKEYHSDLMLKDFFLLIYYLKLVNSEINFKCDKGLNYFCYIFSPISKVSFTSGHNDFCISM